MSKEILLGDEALARAAVDAGISGAYSYPGTPATEIFESVESQVHREHLNIHVRWSSNEKVAYEEALGMSYAGKRALISFKHVGLNVAADPFINSAVSGVHGGLVVAVADDPSMHSSQNEQDSRHYADFARIVCMEPGDQQQAYDMTREAFDISELHQTPVMVRLVTRLSHSRATVVTGDRRDQNPAAYSPEVFRWTLLPTNARRAYEQLLDKQPALQNYAEQHAENQLILRGQGLPGILVSGIAWGYLAEALGEDLDAFNILRLGIYPLPVGKIRRLAESCEGRLWVIEEGYPFIERYISALGLNHAFVLRGRVSGDLPRSGELNPDLIRKAFGKPVARGLELAEAREVLRARPPLLCDGCPHTDAYLAIKEALQDHPQARVMGDIGCYTLGFYEPHHAIHSCICMGSSISMASGISHAGVRPSVCVIGDSTFTHSGLTPLLDAARENTDMTVIVLDNSIVGMTGGQEPMVFEDQLSEMIAGLGVPREHIRVLAPMAKEHDANVAVLRGEIAHAGLSVIIFDRECVTYFKKIKALQGARGGDTT